MKRIFLCTFAVLLLLPACNRQHQDDADGMLRLQLLLAQSAALAVSSKTQARQQAAQLARRAMSGPEMHAMHQGGDQQPMMQATHALGDAVFELLDTRQGGRDLIWRDNLQLAAQAAQLRLSGRLLGGASGEFMLAQGQQSTVPTPLVSANIDKAARRVLELLGRL